MGEGQSTFGAALLDSTRPCPKGISNADGGPAQKRFDVYRNNVTVSLAEALGRSFPVVEALVGDVFFRAMAEVALRQFPPKSPLLMEFGQDIPAFLESFPPVSHLPYLPDIARLENAVRRAYHAADIAALSSDQMAKFDSARFGEIPFTLSPAVSLLSSAYPVGTIWQAHQPDASAQTPNQPEDILISRLEFDPTVDILPEGALAFLSYLDGKRPLSDALSVAPEGFDFSATLTLCLQRGVLASPVKETL